VELRKRTKIAPSYISKFPAFSLGSWNAKGVKQKSARGNETEKEKGERS